MMDLTNRKKTREQWLEQAARKMKPLFKRAGYELDDNWQVSVGWPLGTRPNARRHAIGQCWSPAASAANVTQIFISPELADPVRVLDVLAHELVHHIVGNKEGHGPVFKRCAVAIGLQGKMTATEAGESLTAELTAMAEQLGPYPHGALDGTRAGKKKQTTRLIKAECTNCGLTFRITRKWIENVYEMECPDGSCRAAMDLS